MNDELEKLKGDVKLPLRVIIKRTLKYISSEKGGFILSLLLLGLNVVLDSISPLFTSRITDELVQDNINIKLILNLVLLSFALTCINQAFLYLNARTLQNSGQRIIYRLRREIFEHIENMSLNQFNEMPVGSLVTRVTSYTASMSDLFTGVLVRILRDITTLVGVYVIMFVISPSLATSLLGVIAVVFAISYVFSKIVRGFFRKERACISDINTFLNENLAGMKLTQVFNQEKTKEEQFLEKNEALRKQRFNVIKAFGVYRPLISFIYTCSIALCFAQGIRLGLSAGEIVAFYLYLSKFFNPIQNLADQLNALQKALTASERIFNLLDVKPDVLDKPDAIKIDRFEGRIEFKNVWFAYKDDNWILKDVSFVIEPKQTCAFVGATGAGKTTILSLIVRNYEVQKGEILIDGININDIEISSLRRAIGQMLQDVFLFSGTIKDNITLHDDSFTQEEVEDACRYVSADTFIERLPDKYEEEIIEKGENLSQGQRQLLSFARTVIHKPQILILDEATANIDTETEVLIQQSLEKMKSIGTMLVVAHRLSTIQHADQIIVLQNGRIVEKGDHQQLLKNRGYYYKLYQLQFEN
ncbi:MAG: ABC transporter ATP-binding protein [Erysipelotrichaceae bacterium]|nr:ABC transporter ATP-binding protein [Erysipelotrichaceae bacterium]MBQ1347258.1 ABC transporter ATP-binding protein [Erysipelotrichaceae bacterium]MBQ1740864.1 ABC transporter ATP-binding protein [Erysipelotrichaceae bacterium]MBQ1776044.1 ABC transporter ATP-binding protein [Erysipelotrichaceae bacterium]MBQ1811327.1 ABC transporter ATP-binding protein [Erysipelotrichaceae bacterium]